MTSYIDGVPVEKNRLVLLSDLKDTAGLPEQVVRSLMETSDVGIAVIQGMCIKFTNQQFLDRIGYPREELEKKYVSELIHPDDVDYLVKKYTGISNGTISTSEPLEFRCVAKDGTVIHTETKITLIKWKGATAGLCLFWDIEKRKEAEERLRNEIKKRADILDGFSERLVHTDVQLRIILANRAAGDLAEITPDDLTGLFCYQVFKKKNEPCADCPARETIVTGKAAEGRVIYPGGRVWVIRSYPIVGSRGSPTGLVIKGVDITDIETDVEKPYTKHPPPKASISDSTTVLAAPADPNYLYPFSLTIDCHKGHIVSTLLWEEHGRTMVLTKLAKSELSSARLLYLAARMKSDGEGWADKDSIKAGKMDYNLYELRKAFEESSIPWLDPLSARMMVRSKGEGSGMIRLAIPAEKIDISPSIVGYRSRKHDQVQTTLRKVQKIESELPRSGNDPYLTKELEIQRQNLENIRKSIDTIELLVFESIRLLGLSKKI
jgi:PAS domain S-box-containing protein